MGLVIELWCLPILLLLIGLLLAGAYAYGRWQMRRRWQAIAARLPHGIVLFDATGRCIFRNRAAETLLERFDPAQLEALRQGLATGATRGVLMRGRDGTLVRVQGGALQAGPGVVMTLHDVTAQQQTEANYRKFIHTLSHELLTPLTAIQGHLAHIHASSGADDAHWQGSLRIVQDEVERLTRLTSNLLILSRLEAGQPLQRRPANLSAIAEEAVLSLLDKADARQITLNLVAEPNLPRPSTATPGNRSSSTCWTTRSNTADRAAPWTHSSDRRAARSSSP